MTRANRLMQLMQSLRRLPAPVTAHRLAQDTGVSLRTLYRDIDSLRSMGAVIDGTAGFGYTLVEDAALPPMMFTDDEIEAVVLGLREVQAIADPALAAAAHDALAKLHGRLPQAQARRLQYAVLSADRVMPLPQPGIDAGALRKAAWDERRIKITYRDAQGQVTHRRVDPLGIVYLQASHNLIAFCHLRQGYRTFRLDRLERLELTEESFRPHRVTMLRDAMQKLRRDWPRPTAVTPSKTEQDS